MTDGLRLPKLSVTRAHPWNVAPPDEPLFAHEYFKEIPECESDELEKVKVLSNGYLVRGILPLAQSFAVRHSGIGGAERTIRALIRSTRSSLLSSAEKALFATDEFSNGFFHWFCDVLPRLEALDRADPNELISRTLVVPSMAAFPYASESLAAYDLGSVRLMKKRETVFCKKIMVVPPLAPTGNYRPDLMQSLRERFRRKFSPSSRPDCLFISRAEAPRRKIANEDQLLPILGRHGFVPLVAEKLSFDEQVRRIGSSSILVGNHGAGLTHMLWMKPGSSVLELRRKGDRWDNCYFSLASALDLKYYYLTCNAVNSRDDFHTGNIVVHPAELDNVLSSMRGTAA